MTAELGLRRGRGRPRVDSVAVTVRVAADLHAELAREADARGTSVPEEIRRRCEVLRSSVSL